MLFFALSSRWPRDPVKMQGFELAAISVAPSDFQNFFEVATGPCKNAVNLACDHFLSSLFSLLSFLCSLPSSLLGADPFLSHPAGPGPLANPVVSQLLLFKKPHLGISGGLFCDLFSLLSSRFSLRSSLFSLLSPPVSLLSSLSALFPLLSSLLRTEPFLHHPVALVTEPSSLLSILFSLLSSLFALRY